MPPAAGPSARPAVLSTWAGTRRLLLQGARPAEVAAATGFCDQAHFTRHFRKHTATTPARYARSRAR